ncbi:MAG: hypothetical protein R2809_04050 [Flavobacteriales bacterium]
MKSSTEIAFPTERELRAMARGTLNFSRRKELKVLASNNAFVRDAIEGYRIRHLGIVKRLMIKSLIPIVVVVSGMLIWSVYSSQKSQFKMTEVSAEIIDEIYAAPVSDLSENIVLENKIEPVPIKNRMQRKVQGAGEEKRRVVISLDYIEPKGVTLLELAPPEIGEKALHSKQRLLWIAGVMFYEIPQLEDATLFTPEFGLDARFENKAAAETSEKVMALPQISEHQYISIAGAVASGNWQGVDVLARRQLEENSNDLNLLFYAGIANYKMGNFEEAKVFFEKQSNASFSAFEVDRTFYYAASVYLSGDIAKGTKLLKLISNENGYYKLRADKLLTE